MQNNAADARGGVFFRSYRRDKLVRVSADGYPIPDAIIQIRAESVDIGDRLIPRKAVKGVRYRVGRSTAPSSPAGIARTACAYPPYAAQNGCGWQSHLPLGER